MSNEKNVLTTGQVAKICNVAPRTVSKWFDSGQLQGYRIPGSKDRRIPVEQLVRFMRANGIPLNGLETGTTRVLVVDPDAGACEAIRSALAEGTRYEVHGATSAFEAGLIARDVRPHVIVVDLSVPGLDPRALSRAVRSTAELTGTRLLGMGQNLPEHRGQALLQEGFDGYLGKPFEMQRLVALVDDYSPAPEFD